MIRTQHIRSLFENSCGVVVFRFFFLSTMTLAIVQTFSVSILQAMHQVSFEAATLTLTAYMLCAAAGMFWVVLWLPVFPCTAIGWWQLA